MAPGPPDHRERPAESDHHLRSTREVIGYHLHEIDDAVGHVDDFIIDEQNWAIRYLAIDTSHWGIGHKTLITPEWIASFEVHGRIVQLLAPKDLVKNTPRWEPDKAIVRAYEDEISEYYARRIAWSNDPRSKRVAAETSRSTKAIVGRPQLLSLAFAACINAAPPRPHIALAAGESDHDRRRRLIAQVQDEILTQYNEPFLPYGETSLLPPAIGTTRIGVGPDDFIVSETIGPRHWPWSFDNHTSAKVESQQLEIHLSRDKEILAAWADDRVVWRIGVCGHFASVLLRMTTFYARDGDRWIRVFEHL
ncbi:MAG: hypothetical protein ABJE66_30385 [Deltaproteobacteria bacterium]